MLFSWLGKRSLFMATDDWSPVQSIRLMLIFSQKSKEGVTPSLLLCGGRGALPALLAMTSPLPRGRGCCAKKGTEKLQCSLQPMWEPACWMGFPGRNDAFPSLLSFPCSTGGLVNARWYQSDALGTASPRYHWVTGEGSLQLLLLLSVGNLMPFMIQKEKREFLSIVLLAIMDCFIVCCFFFNQIVIILWCV